MKIFILRHEDRTQDASLFAPLTKIGLDKSLKLANILDEINITTIYSSPYIRTLQTIYPYVKKKGKNVKIDYSLSEINDDNLISKNSVGTNLPEYIAESFLYDSQYKSVIQPENIPYPEKEKDVQKRIKQFLKGIILNHYQKDDNIVIVTHQVVCSNILKIINKLTGKNIDESNIKNYPIGGLTLVLNNLDWVFQPINWKEKKSSND
jgi:2,3-bisphosphoglycerate-dependent phosphoglycerate mutase